MQISVIIPSFLPRDYIFQCLDSLCAQTFPKDSFEVIVVLNGCRQPYEDRLKEYFAAHPEMKWVFLQTDTPGVSNARNMALDVIRGEYVAFIDDDDYVSPRYLEGLYAVAERDGCSVPLSYTYAFRDGNEKVQLPSPFTRIYERRASAGRIASKDMRHYFSGPCMKLVPASAIGDRRFDTGFRNGEDSLFMFLISDRMKWCRFAPDDAVYHVRYRSGSAITKEGDFFRVVSNRLKLCVEYSKIFWRHPLRYSFKQYVQAVLGSFHVIAIKAGALLRPARTVPDPDASKKKILIIANFPSKLDSSSDGRFVYLAKILCRRGYEVEMIVSDFDHHLKCRRQVTANPYEFRLTFIHEPGYPGNVSLKRLWSHYAWGRNVGKYLRSLPEAPDVIYSAVPSLTAARKAAAYCRACGNPRPRFIIDIQDLWPEAFLVVVRNPFLRSLFRPVGSYIDRAYRAADTIVGVSDTYRDRGLSVNAGASGLTVYLGNDGQLFDNARERWAEDRTGDEFRLAYIGTMGYSYDLECAIDAIRIVGQRGKVDRKIVFVAMGGGPLLDRYRQYAADAGIESVFTGPLPYDRMVGKLCSCDAVINCLRPGAAQSITNKVGDYALAGKPVINTQENAEYRELLEKSGCGINCACGNAAEVADAIERLALNGDECRDMGARSRELGIERFDRRRTYPLIVEKIENELK